MDQPIATVNGSPIDDKALRAAMQSLAQENFHATLAEVPPDAHDDLQVMAMERLVARELIFQAALAEGLVADDAAVEAETARILRMMGQPKDFWPRLAERGRTIKLQKSAKKFLVEKGFEHRQPAVVLLLHALEHVAGEHQSLFDDPNVLPNLGLPRCTGRREDQHRH